MDVVWEVFSKICGGILFRSFLVRSFFLSNIMDTFPASFRLWVLKLPSANTRKIAGSELQNPLPPYSVKKLPQGGFLAMTRDHGHLEVPG